MDAGRRTDAGSGTQRARAWSLALPWLCLIGLQLLFEAPSALRPDAIDLRALSITPEVPALLALYVASLRLTRHGGAVRGVLLACTVVLVLVRIDHAIFFTVMRTTPLLYDQLFMARHLFVLVGDLWSWEAAAIAGGGLLGIALASWAAARLVAVFRRAFEPPRARASAIVLGTYLAAAAGMTQVVRADGAPVARWMTPALADNLHRSYLAHRSVRRGIQSSPYQSYRKLSLARRPHIKLFLVESYGAIMARNEWLRSMWGMRLAEMERNLRKRGWSFASAFSRAPVSGARSWLSEASLLMGTPVVYEAVYHHLLEELDSIPHLVRILDRLGYTTVLLAPADRARPGVEEVNHYGYDRYVRFDDLAYRGRRMGWGLVPDQYSLRHTERHVLSLLEGPVFFNFHTVSSHAPWRVVPQLSEHWRELNRLEGEIVEDPRDGELEKRLKRYRRKSPRFRYMGELNARYRYRYARAIHYELRVIESFLQDQHGDQLVIVVGDHQPPIVSEETESFDVPIHVLARDPVLLEEFLAQGFSPGLLLAADQPAVVRHEGLLSLLVRSLVRCCGRPNDAPPPYLPRGSALGAEP